MLLSAPLVRNIGQEPEPGKNMRLPATLLIILLLAGCGPKNKLEQEAAHGLTEIPFNIDNLSDEQRAVIRSANESDTSSYLIRSRPVVFQIVVTGNDADEVRLGGPLDRQVDVLIYALGEAEGDRLVDYGWIENVETGATVWKMTAEKSVHAGGDSRNRKAVARLTLEPGSYHLRYVSNSTHAYPDWQGGPPERQRFYGVTVFNMTALPLLEKRLKQAGVPGLRTSLEPGT